MKSRKRLTRSKSRRNFRRGAKVNKRNFRRTAYRTGTRF